MRGARSDRGQLGPTVLVLELQHVGLHLGLPRWCQSRTCRPIHEMDEAQAEHVWHRGSSSSL